MLAASAASVYAVLQRLLKAKEVFAKADEDKGGNLDVNEFIVAFKGVLRTDEGDGPDALRRLFARIDANADGTVDWREFSSYILLENDSAARYSSAHSTIQLSSIQPADLVSHPAFHLTLQFTWRGGVNIIWQRHRARGSHRPTAT